MDLKSNHTAPVLTDPSPISKSRLGVYPNLLPYSHTGAFSSELILNIPRKKTGILDDVRACSWLDAMKASSPPHRKMMKDSNNELTPIDSDAAYRAWMVIISPFNRT
jgi:trehalose 6-phosphate phosphatase